METQSENPFRTPEASLVDNGTQATVDSLLYKLPAVGLATFFGTPIAGAWILQHNLRQLGLSEKIKEVWLCAVILLVAVVGIGWVLPDNVPGLPFAVVQIVVMQQYAKKLLGERMAGHTRYYSNWRAFGISLLFGIVVIGLLVVALLPFVS
ncbi:MAG: hypothetical protein GAK45_01246 [Pseudomonas citronellolis]|nr:MAG: hypothetical protein GAK45_01246 [Pseudomonas citronellolis]